MCRFRYLLLALCSSTALTYHQEISRDSCAEQCLDVSIAVHTDKLYRRLGSRKYCRVPSDRNDLVSLSGRLTGWIEKLSQPCTNGNTQQRLALLFQTKQLYEAILSTQRMPRKQDLEALKEVVKKAYSVSGDGVSLACRLQEQDFSRDVEERKEFRQVNALANHWRICLSLSKSVRSYRRCFKRISLQVLVPFPGRTLGPAKGRKRHVHAEVQLIVSHEISAAKIVPRAIGASKKAFYLCDAFIRAHGRFVASKAHGQLYEKWYVPDQENYSSSTLQRLISSMTTVHHEVATTLARLRSSRTRHPPPVQSAINLTLPTIHSASVSTLGPRLTNRPPSVTDSLQHVANYVQPSAVTPDQLTKSSVILERSEANDNTTDRSGGHVKEDQLLEVYRDHPRVMDAEWLTLELSFEDSSLNPLQPKPTTIEAQQAPRRHDHGSVVASSKSLIRPGRTQTVVDFSKLAPGETRVLSKSDESESLDCVLVHGVETPISLRFQWHAQNPKSTRHS